jgi:hypothetical protein
MKVYISGVQQHFFRRHKCGDKGFTIATLYLNCKILEKYGSFTITNQFMNNCLSPHLKLLSPHVANGDKVGHHWFTSIYRKKNS